VSAVWATDPIVEQILDELEPLVARQRRAVARHGCLRAISSTHLHVLFLLECDGAQTMGHLADQLGASLPNVTGIVDRMAERGLVERLRDDDDRRVVVVRATPAGRQAVEEIDMVRRRQFGRLIETLTPEQQERALRTFRELREAADRIKD
jgi:DNA-binding MarR family transcriptional regulator